jgi:DNA-binding GntR family transcriptional regulator
MAAPSDVLMPMIESLWLRFGPFMRSVYGLMGTANLVDQHQRAIEAIEARDETELRAAIRADILDGMNMIGTVVLGNKQAS